MLFFEVGSYNKQQLWIIRYSYSHNCRGLDATTDWYFVEFCYTVSFISSLAAHFQLLILLWEQPHSVEVYQCIALIWSEGHWNLVCWFDCQAKQNTKQIFLYQLLHRSMVNFGTLSRVELYSAYVNNCLFILSSNLVVRLDF